MARLDDFLCGFSSDSLSELSAAASAAGSSSLTVMRPVRGSTEKPAAAGSCSSFSASTLMKDGVWRSPWARLRERGGAGSSSDMEELGTR